MDFCDKATVRKAIEGKRIALVGSGPGVLDNEPGLIDSHDVVVRISNYKLMQNTGSRTDVFYSFFGSSIKKTAKELQQDGVYLCMCKCPNAQFMESAWHRRHGKMAGVDFRYIYNHRKDFWFCDTYVPTVPEFLAHFDLLGRHVPTTGFSGLLDVLSYDPASIYMTGFDFFSSGIHNVNERWKRMNPSDPIGHVPDAERNWFIRNVDKLPIIMDKRLKQIVRRPK
jgi:hypothetical protein